MRKNIAKLSLVLLVFTVISCKDEHNHLVIDPKTNLIVAQDQISHEKTDLNKPKLKPEEYPKVQFADTAAIYDFGTIKEGEIVKHSFKLKNVGGTPLVISHAQASCGCTVPEWTKGEIKVGGEAEVNIQFNSNNKPGIQNKTVTLITNTEEGHEFIKFKANVTPKSK